MFGDKVSGAWIINLVLKRVHAGRWRDATLRLTQAKPWPLERNVDACADRLAGLTVEARRLRLILDR